MARRRTRFARRVTEAVESEAAVEDEDNVELFTLFSTPSDFLNLRCPSTLHRSNVLVILACADQL